MRTETVTREIFTFDELSEEAQQKAIDNNRDINTGHEWWEWDYEDAANIGLKITSFDLDRNKGADGRLRWGSMEVARKITEEHGEKCQTHITAKNFLKEWGDLVLQHSNGVETDIVAEENAYEFDKDADGLEEEFLKNLLSDYADILQKQYEYLYSDEAIKETIQANAYEFTEDGERA